MDYFVVHILIFSCFLPQHASLSAQETEVAHVGGSHIKFLSQVAKDICWFCSGCAFPLKIQNNFTPLPSTFFCTTDLKGSISTLPD